MYMEKIYMNEKTTTTEAEIVALYQRCGVDTNKSFTPRSTINTGRISPNFGYNLQLGQQPTTSADRFRWS